MIERDDLQKLRDSQQKSRFASEAKSMFVNGEFNTDNWNGGDGNIRQFTYDVDWKWGNNNRCWEIDWKVGDHNHSGDAIVQYVHFEDFNYVTIIVRGYDCDDDEHDWYLDQYLIQYYKNHGKTDRILYNGNPITEEQYLVLLNLIEQTGFEFIIENKQ